MQHNSVELVLGEPTDDNRGDISVAELSTKEAHRKFIERYKQLQDAQNLPAKSVFNEDQLAKEAERLAEQSNPQDAQNQQPTFDERRMAESPPASGILSQLYYAASLRPSKVPTPFGPIGDDYTGPRAKLATATNEELLGFIWPVRGKVVVSYGAKLNGKTNDGIDISVPLGTPVKASESGIVTYSGDDLEGYGNAILIRHAQGFVTVYTDLGKRLVNRGDQIQRGDIIGKSGLSGKSPLLHFEIRRGYDSIEPTRLLDGK